jgi:hypothetical protein
MPVQIDDEYLEQQIAEEAKFRGHKAAARTASALITERLTELRTRRAMTDAATSPEAGSDAAKPDRDKSAA